MDIKQLRYFLHVCDAPSMSDAAYAAHISQPALSRQIRLLEDELGVALFERHARGVTPSEAGRRLREEAIRLVSDAERIRETLSMEVSQPRGTVSIGTPSSLRRFLIAPAIGTVRDAHPDVRFRVREGTSRGIRDLVLGGEADVAVVSSLEELEPFQVTPLLSESLFLVGPRGSLPGGDGHAGLHLLGELALALTPSPNSLRVVVDRALSREGLRARTVVEIESFEMALELVRRGDLYTVFPYCALHEAMAAGVVEAQPIQGLTISWVAVTTRDRGVTAATAVLRSALLSSACALVHDGTWKTAVLHPMVAESPTTSRGRTGARDRRN